MGDRQAYSHLDVRGPGRVNTGFWKRLEIPEVVDHAAAATAYPSATDTPTTVDPSATDTPASAYPSATDAAASAYPSATGAAASAYPSATGAAASAYPSATDSPATMDPSATDSPATMDPSATDSPATMDPSATDTPASAYPSATDSPATVYSYATGDPPATTATAASGNNPKTVASAHPSARPGGEDGGPSGDSGPNAGGFGSDPAPVPPPKPDWTGYDDLNNRATPDKARDALEAAIKGNLKDKEAPSFTQRYDLSDQKKKDTSPRALYSNAAEYFRDFQLSTQDQYIQGFVRNQGPQGRVNRSPAINEAAFSPDGKVVIAAYSDTDNDTLPPAHRTRWSEFVFQQMKQYAETKTAPYDIKKLQFLVRVNVGHPETVNTIKKAFPPNGLKFGKDRGVFRASAKTKPEADAFNAILRTENVRGVNWMLGDHHTELGDKRIKALHIYTDGEYPNIFIEVE
jgi:hypothetical protein